MVNRGVMKRCVLIYLVLLVVILSIPLAYAQASDSWDLGKIASISIYGDNNVHKIIRLNSQEINVKVSINQIDVPPKEVTFKLLGQEHEFESCSNAGTTSSCLLSLANSGNFGEGKFDYKLTYSSGGRVVDKDGVFVIDGTPPLLSNFKLQSVGGKLVLRYDVEEKASSIDYCSGLSKVEIATSSSFSNSQTKDYMGGVSFLTFLPTVTDLQKCLLNGEEFEFNPPADSGKHTFYVRATDKAGNSPSGGVSLDPYNLDVSFPKVLNFSFYIGTQRQKALSAGLIRYTIKANIEENNNVRSAKLDLSSLGGSQTTGSCRKESSELFQCSWTDTLKISSGSISLPIEIEDSSGNVFKGSLSNAFTLDEQGPRIPSLRFVSGDGRYVGKTNNTLFAEITDDADVNLNKVFANLKQLNPSRYSGLVRGDCSNTPAGVTCYWRSLEPDPTLASSIVIKVNAEDTFGQSSEISETFSVDLESPTITSIIPSTKFPTASMSEDLVITVKADDDTGLGKVSADLSSLSTSLGNVDGTCTLGECEIRIDPLLLPTSPAKGNIEISLKDNAGNEVTDSVSIEVLEGLPTSSPRLYRAVVGEFIPKKLDRKIVSNTLVNVRLPIKFETPPGLRSKPRIVAKDIVRNECSSPVPDAIIGTPYIMGQSLETSYLVLPIKMDGFNVNLPEIPINCSVAIMIAEGGTLHTNPQVIELKVNGKLPTLELYNNPIGSAPDNIASKLRSIKKSTEDWSVGGGKLKGVNDFITNAKGVCNVATGVAHFYEAIEAAKEPVYGAVFIIHKIPGFSRVADFIWKGYLGIECTTRVVKENIWPSANEFEYDGTFSKFIGGKRKEGTTPGIDVKGYEVGGLVRNMCSLVLCTQCGQGFGYAQQLANLNFSDKNLGNLYGLSGRQPYDPLLTDNERLQQNKKPLLDSTGKGIPQTPASNFLANANFEAHIDPYDNWFTSLSCGCLPGIIHNAEKYRQLQCVQAKCISDRAKLGLPIDKCDQEFAYNECVFFKGDGWRSILTAAFIPWFETMANTARNFVIDLPQNTVLQLKDEFLCKEWKTDTDKAFKGTLGGEDVISNTKSVGACWTEATNRENLAAPTNVYQAITCGGLDATIFGDSISEYKKNAVKPLKDAFDGMGEDGIDYCDGAFALLDKYDADKAKAKPVTTKEDGSAQKEAPVSSANLVGRG
jgi:hypothetical protein